MEDNILDADFREEKYQTINYVGFWPRVGASLIDVVVMIPIFVLVFLNLVYLKSLTVDLLLALLMIIYKPFFEFKYGATLGKMALKIKILSEEFEQIGLQTSIIRNFLYMLPGLISFYTSFRTFNHPDFSAIDSFWAYAELVEEIPDPTGNSLSWLLIIAVVLVAFTAKKQGLHDMMAKTVCVYGGEE